MRLAFEVVVVVDVVEFTDGCAYEADSDAVLFNTKGSA